MLYIFVLTRFIYFGNILCRLLFRTGYVCHCSRRDFPASFSEFCLVSTAFVRAFSLLLTWPGISEYPLREKGSVPETRSCLV